MCSSATGSVAFAFLHFKIGNNLLGGHSGFSIKYFRYKALFVLGNLCLSKLKGQVF